MGKFTKFFIAGFVFYGVVNTDFVFAREQKRVSKVQKASNYKDSVGLIVKKGASSTSVKCGKNAQPNANGSACECLDPVNYVMNTLNSKECFQKTDPVVIAQKKACGNVFLNAVERDCANSLSNNGLSEDKTFKCYDPSDLFLKLDTSGLSVYIDGKQYEYDKVCYIYTEDLSNMIATRYSITGVNSPNCKLKRVVAEASNECFQAVLAAGKAYGATKSIASDLQRICGYTGLHAKWSKLFGTDDSSVVSFPKNIPDLYLQAGKLSAADGVALVGNLLDGKITDKSNTWELNITEVLNSHLNDVGAACGKEYEISKHNTNLQLSDDKSSLQRAVDEKGALKGGQDWVMMQASVFIGEDKANKVIRDGAFGKSDDEKKDVLLTVITDVKNFDDLEYEKLKKGGRFVLVGETEYSIIDVVKNTARDDMLEYTFVKYSSDIDLSNEAYKLIMGKTEKILKDGTITKGEY